MSCLVCSGAQVTLNTSNSNYYLDLNSDLETSTLKSGNQSLILNPVKSEFIFDSNTYMRFKPGNVLLHTKTYPNERHLVLREDLNSLAYGTIVYLNQQDTYTELRHNEAGLLLEDGLRSILKYDDSRIAVYTNRVNIETEQLLFQSNYDAFFLTEFNQVPLSALTIANDSKSKVEFRSYELRSTFNYLENSYLYQSHTLQTHDGLIFKHGLIDDTGTFLGTDYIELTLHVSGSNFNFNQKDLIINSLGNLHITSYNDIDLTQFSGDINIVTAQDLNITAEDLNQNLNLLDITADAGISILNNSDGISIINDGNDDILIKNTGNGRLLLVNDFDIIEIGKNNGPEVKIYSVHTRYNSDQHTFSDLSSNTLFKINTTHIISNLGKVDNTIIIASGLTLTDSHYCIFANTVSGAITITLPLNPVLGRIYEITKISTNNILTIDPNGNLINNTSGALLISSGSLISRTLRSDGTNWFIVAGVS